MELDPEINGLESNAVPHIWRIWSDRKCQAIHCVGSEHQ